VNTDRQKQGKKTVAVPATMAVVLGRIAANGWPRRVGKTLFVHDQHGVCPLEKTEALFGWLASRDGNVTWRGGKGYVTQAQAFAELRRTAQRHDAIETCPHHPPLPGHYYACDALQPGDGAKLKQLLDFFCLETPLDRQLLQAAFATPLWGGQHGGRPAFEFTAREGRGIGKTKTAEAIARLYGGSVDVSPQEEIAVVKQRLLTPDAWSKRVVLLDNVKSTRFSWGQLEALITASTISGKQLYIGEASMPNRLTWLITMNGASLSTDLAQRVVEIKLRRPTYRPTWDEELRRFIDDHRQQILGDLLAFLQRSKTPLPCHSRWSEWESEVVGRLDSPAECVALIHRRRQEIDVEQEEGGIIEDHFAGRIRRLDFDPERDDVFIPNPVAVHWYNQATGEHAKTTAVTRALRQLIDEGRAPRLAVYRVPGSGKRGFRWIGEHCDEDAPTHYDLEKRLALQDHDKAHQEW